MTSASVTSGASPARIGLGRGFPPGSRTCGRYSRSVMISVPRMSSTPGRRGYPPTTFRDLCLQERVYSCGSEPLPDRPWP
jgi:hypothetical protein